MTATAGRSLRLLAVLVLLAGPTALAQPDSEAAMKAADELWAGRAGESRDGRADSAAVQAAISAYATLAELDPANIEARWKLLRAEHFYGDYVLADEGERLTQFERTRAMADEGRAYLLRSAGLDPEERDPQTVAAALEGTPDEAAIFIYSAIHWGRWGELTGKMKAARQGVAGRLRDYAETSVLLDETFDEAGGRRFLGRLHSEAPKIPLVTGWIDRKRAVEELDRACALAPENRFNQLFLADALQRFRKDRREEARERLARLIDLEPRNTYYLEDIDVSSQARALLD